MKKIYLIILLILIILTISVILIIINNNDNAEPTQTQYSSSSQNINNIFISIKDNTISPTGLTVIVDDKNEIKSNILISMNYYIDKKTEDKWEEIYTYVSPIEIYVANINYPHESKLDWENELGELKPGTYRIRYYPILNMSKEIQFNIN